MTEVTDSSGQAEGAQPGWQQLNHSRITTELIKTAHRLERFKREISQTEKSPRFLILDHCIESCNAYLENLIEEEHHLQLARNIRRYRATLKSELQNLLAILDQSPETNPAQGIPAHTPLSDQSAHSVRLPCTPTHDNRSDTGCVHDPASGSNSASAARPLLEIRTFGEFRIFLNGKKIDCQAKGKCKQLFKFLAVRDHKPIPREQIMELFWPGHNEQSARNNLNVAIYSLRQSLKKHLTDISAVLFKDGCYQMNPEIRLWIDANEMERCLQAALKHESRQETGPMIAKLQQAEKLYTGPFLDEDAYCDWVIEKQQQLQESYLLILKKLDACYQRQGRIADSIEINKKILAIDLCNEKAHQRLMENYLAQGQRHLALKQFGLCKKALKQELDLTPDESLLALFNRIRSARTA